MGEVEMGKTSISFPGIADLDPAIIEGLKKDLQTTPVRPLTTEEREIYAGGVINAVRIMPAFRDAVGLLNPYMDATCETAYTDRYARVAVGYWFLHCLNPYQRGAVLLHEAMHVLNNHFNRAEVMGLSGDLMNISGDFEINTTLERVPGVDLAVGIFPDKGQFKFPRGMSMEQYAQLLQQEGFDKPEDLAGPDGKGQPDPSGQDEDQSGQGQGEGSGEGDEPGEGSGSGSGSGEGSGDSEGQGSGSPSSQSGGGSGNGQGSGSGTEVNEDKNSKSWGCGSSTEKRSAAADEAGIDRASSAEQSTVKSNTAARISEAASAARAAGQGHMEEFYKIVLDHIRPPRVDWRNVFRRVVASANDAAIRGRSDYSYRRVSRRLSNKDYIFPGMVKYVPTAMLGIDISGSMTKDDYERTLTEAEGILKSSSRAKNGLRVFPVDTQVGNIKTVASVREVNLYGGGGTDMSVAFSYVATLGAKDKPDIFVLATDGGTDWGAVEREVMPIYRKIKCVVLVTSKYGWDSVPDSLRNLITMIDVSGE